MRVAGTHRLKPWLLLRYGSYSCTSILTNVGAYAHGDMPIGCILDTTRKEDAMPRESKRAKRERAVEVCRRMGELYPQVESALWFRNPYELVISVLLSAQTTDAAVNKVTPELFRRWPDPESLAAADVAEVGEVIRTIGFWRAKAEHAVGAAQMISYILLINKKITENQIIVTPVYRYLDKMEKAKLNLFKNAHILLNPNKILENKNNKYNNLIEKLTVLNPFNTLKRGYAIVKKEDKVVNKVNKIKINDTINIDLYDGNIVSKIIDIKEKQNG